MADFLNNSIVVEPEVVDEIDEQFLTGSTKEKAVPEVKDDIDKDPKEVKLPQTEDKKEEEEEEDEEKLPEYKNIPDLINKSFDGDLNIEALGDLTKEDEARVVVDLFGRVIEGANRQIEQYEDIKKLLEEDKDLKEFIQFRKNGGTLQDLAKNYVSKEELSDEELIRKDIKRQFKDWTPEEVEEQLELYKESNKLKKIADSIRKVEVEESKIDLEKINKQKEEDNKVEREKEEQAYLKEVDSYKNYLTTKKDLVGIPLTDEMKNNILALAVGKEKGSDKTYLETALQSEEGVLRAALGILYLEKLINAGKSIAINKDNKRLADKLFMTPDELQRNKKGTKPQLSDIDIANQF